MSDTKPIDVMKSMTIRSVPTRVIDGIKEAADDEKLTVGQWVERRFDEWTSAGRPVHVPEPTAPLALTGPAAAAEPDTLPAIIEAITQLGRMPADVPKSVRQMAWAEMRARLKAMPR